MTRAFVSYCHVDELYRAELQKHLTLLQKQGLIDVWNDHRIPAGGELEVRISAELEAAELILLLVSPDFMASDYCYSVEMRRAMERHEDGTAIVVPIIVRPTDWHSGPFGKLKALPRDGKPVVKWTTLDDAFLDVVKSLRALVSQRANQSGAGVTRAATPPTLVATQVAAPRPRSSNLALRKEFSDMDRDRFLDEGFAFIREYFENSVEELGPRNPGYEGRLRLISNDAFTATIYRDGKKVAGCFIRLSSMYGGRHRQIGYSNSDSGTDNSFNELVSVDADEQAMFFKMQLSTWGGQGDKLTFTGAAEALWKLFVERLA